MNQSIAKAGTQLTGRILMSAIFITAGIHKIGAYAGTQGYMESAGVPGILLPLVILLEIGGAHPNTVLDPPPKVQMEALADSALSLKLLVFINDVGNSVTTRTELYVEILKRFQAAGIDIPFPQRDVQIKLPAAEPKKD